jgi:MFS family permease
MIGTLILGRLGDRMGRKPVFLVSASIVSVAGLLTAASQSYWMLLSFRFWVGFGLGGVVIPFDTLTEIMPAKQRGKCLPVDCLLPAAYCFRAS